MRLPDEQKPADEQNRQENSDGELFYCHVFRPRIVCPHATYRCASSWSGDRVGEAGDYLKITDELIQVSSSCWPAHPTPVDTPQVQVLPSIARSQGTHRQGRRQARV